MEWVSLGDPDSVVGAKAAQGCSHSKTLREALDVMECGSPLPLWSPQRSWDPPPGVLKSCRGLQQSKTLREGDDAMKRFFSFSEGVGSGNSHEESKHGSPNGARCEGTDAILIRSIDKLESNETCPSTLLAG